MKRCLVLMITMPMLCCFAGCGAESHDGLIQSTILMIDRCATGYGVISEAVKTAADKYKEGKTTKFDLENAMSAAEKLKENQKMALDIKKKIDRVRFKVTDEEREAAARAREKELNIACGKLLKQREDLMNQMVDAEQLGSAAREKISQLREKLRDAESPFEALAR